MSESSTPMAYSRGPDTKQTTSARLHRSTRRGLDAVVQLWKLRAERVGDDAEAIDLTYVMDSLLAAGIQAELKPYLDKDGQLPTSESAWEAILARIEKQH